MNLETKLKNFLSSMALSVLLFAANGAQAQSLAVINGTNDGVQLEITEMKSAEGFLTLRGIVRNETANTVDGPNIRDVYLVDSKNMKKHLVITDSNLVCICSEVGSFEANSSTKVWARFASPQDGVTAVSVVWGMFEPADVVPLSQ